MTLELTLEQLRTVPTDEAVLDEDLIPVLQELGVDCTSWQSGSKQRDLLEGLCHAYVISATRRSVMSYMLYLADAEDAALAGLALSHFAETRIEATYAEHPVVFTGGPIAHVVVAGDVVVSDASGNQFRNIAGGTIPASPGTITLTCRAEIAGSTGNVGINTITTMVTTYAGVTCTNSAAATVLAIDTETDAALRLRCAAKWSTLSVLESIDDRWTYMAWKALPNCRVRVDASNPGGPGTFWVWFATATGVGSDAQRILIQAAIDAEFFEPGDPPTGATGATVYASGAFPVPISGTVSYTGDSPQNAVEAALDVYCASIPIGGWDVDTRDNILPADDIPTVIRAVTGVRAYTPTYPAPGVDLGVTAWTVVTFTYDLTYVPA
jgi:hypothetical protein